MNSNDRVPLPGRTSVGRQERSPETPRSSVAACGLLLASSLAAVFLAGGTLQGSLGLFLVGAGVPMVCCPPRVKVDWRLWVTAAGPVCCGALAFLPAHWWPLPPWRAALEKESIVPLPATISTEPWTTAFWLGFLTISILLGLFLLAHPLRSKWLFRYTFLAVLASGAYAALAIFARRSGWHYPFDAGATFGFFPNRNHTATFLVTGSILALAALTVSLRDRHWLSAGLMASALSTCVAALFFYSGSRAGVIFVLLGGFIWIAGLGRGHLNLRLLVSFATLLVAGVILFLTTESEVRGRLFAAKPTASPAPATANAFAKDNRAETKTPPFDFRVLIYRDALHLIRDSPVTGTGLGCFGLVFPQYRKASLSEAAAIHPESDWLMLVAEAGIPSFLCLLVLLGFLGRRLRLSRDHPFWPLRWGCVAAALTACLHGLVDVPMHRVELGWWVLLIAGLGFQISGDRRETRSRSQHLFFMAGGLAAIVLGGGLVRAEWFGGKPLPPFKAEKARDKVFMAYQHQDFAGATKLARQAISDSPMDEPLYFQLGVLLAQTETDDAESDRSFKAQRLLNPFLTSIPLRQGEVWMNDDPDRTTALWQEALERSARLSRATGQEMEAKLGLYQDLIRRSAGKPALEKGLLNLAAQNPHFTLVWLESATPDTVKEEIGALAGNQAFFQQLSGEEHTRFLLRWYAVGDRDSLDRFVADHPDWSTWVWPLWIREMINGQNFEQATREAAVHYGVSLTLPDPPVGNAPMPSVELEVSDPVAAFVGYRQAGNMVAARRVLEEARPDLPPALTNEILRVKAAAASQAGEWPAAWQALEAYLRNTGKSTGF